MLDGVKLFCQIPEFESWRRAVNLDLFTPTDLETGAVRGKTRQIGGWVQQTIPHRGNFQTYQLTIKETIKSQVNGKRSVSYFLIVDGSLHKNNFGGANYLPFTWDRLQTELNSLETGLQLTGDTEIVNLEIGVNIGLPFPVFTFLNQNLISYKGNQFNRYNPDKNGVCLGYVCPLSQYSVKVYDKGKQFDLPGYLMRFELRYLKMQTLKERGIKRLTDLKDLNKVNGLLGLLLTAWDNILLFDSSIELKNFELRDRDRNLLREGRRAGFWEDLRETNPRRYNYQREKFRSLVAKYGQGWHGKIRELIKTQWENLFENCTILPTVPNPELYDFTVKVKGKNVQSRSCLSCGKDITHQDSRSKFCSARFVGEAAAHQCRNRDSNPRNNLRNKIRRIKSRGVLFDITPYLIVNNNKKQVYAI